MAIVYIRPRAPRAADYGKVTEHNQSLKWLCYSTSRFETDYNITQYGWSNNILPIPYVTWISGINPLISLLCRGLKIDQQKDSPQHYEITATYSSEPLSQAEKEAQQDPNPLDRPAKIKWRSNKYNKAIYKDNNDELILNSAGDFFDPPVEIDRSRWVINVSKNLEGVPSYILDYIDGVNESDFEIQGIAVEAQQAKLVELDVSDEQVAQVGEDEITYFVFSYGMEINPDTWELKVLDQGMRQIDPNNSSNRIAIKDDSVPARFVSKPWPLDGNGKKLANPSPSNAVKKSFDVLNLVDYSVLPGVNDNL